MAPHDTLDPPAKRLQSSFVADSPRAAETSCCSRHSATERRSRRGVAQGTIGRRDSRSKHSLHVAGRSVPHHFRVDEIRDGYKTFGSDEHLALKVVD